VRKSFDVILYVINRIYKVCLNLFGLVLNVLLIFYVKILREMEKRERGKKSRGPLSAAAQAQDTESFYLKRSNMLFSHERWLSLVAR
jgi:hypothetical protein